MNNLGKYKRLITDTFVFALGNLGSKVILFFMVPLYTNCLTTEEYGVAELIHTVGNLLLPITSFVIFDAVLRFSLDHTIRKENVIFNAGIVFLFGSLISIGLAPIIGLYSSLRDWKWYVSAYIISCMSTQISMTYIKGNEKSKLYVILGLAQTFLLAILNIFFLLVLKLNIRGFLLASIIGHFLIAFISIVAGNIISDIKKANYDRNLLLQMLSYSIPLIINNLSWWVVQSSDKLMVELLISSAALGIYSISSKIPALINIITSIFSQAWGISSVKEYDSSKDKFFYSNVFRLFSFVVFFFCSCILVVIKPFMFIYVGKNFYESWKYVPWLLVAASFSAISSYFGSIYGALKKSVNVMISTLLSALINIFLNFLLIPRIGIMGATIATAIAYLFIAFYRMFDSRKFFSFKIDFVKEFATYFLVLISAFFVTIDKYGLQISTAIVLLIILLHREEIFVIFKNIFSFRGKDIVK